METPTKNITTEEPSVTAREIVDLIKECQEYYEILEKTVKDGLYNKYKIDNIDIIEAVLQFKKEELEGLNTTDIKILLSGYTEIDSLEDLQMKTDEELKQELSDVKNSSMMLFSAKSQMDEIIADGTEVLNEYQVYRSSNTLTNQRKERIKSFEQAKALLTDEKEIKHTQSMIDSLQASIDFSFLMQRFEKLGDKEIRNITEGFLDNTMVGAKGNYIIKRYMEKAGKYNVSPNIYKYFFNIEENFLEKEYHVYNNLFLYIYMRTIAYSDPYKKTDVLFMSSLTGALSKLVYHHFVMPEDEIAFLNVIRKVLDYFRPYEEEFRENNTLQPEHKKLIEARRRMKEEKKEALFDAMDRIGMDITEYKDSDKSYDELSEIYQKHAKKLIRQSNEEYASTSKDDDRIARMVDQTKKSIDILKMESQKNGNSYIQSLAHTSSIGRNFEHDEMEDLENGDEEGSSSTETAGEEGSGIEETCISGDHGSEGNDESQDKQDESVETEVVKEVPDTSLDQLASEEAKNIYNAYLKKVSDIRNTYKQSIIDKDTATKMMKDAYMEYKYNMSDAGFLYCYSEEFLEDKDT